MSKHQKATPKKVINIHEVKYFDVDDESPFGDLVLQGKCPICKKDVEESYNYCPNCGPALDWK